jgi:GDPmannose 4,6-dehydratase
MKVALITGITGQDGAYLSDFLLKKDYKIIGVLRSYNRDNISKLLHLNLTDKIIFEECDLSDLTNIYKLIEKFEPDEIYNLAAQSSVGISFRQPISTINFNTLSVLNLLEAIKLLQPKIKFYQASSSEMFGRIANLPINEETVLNPISPYGVSKASAHLIVSYYRQAYNIFASSGILFNHESFLRSNNFFVKKILRESIQIKYGFREVISVGNIKIKRDFGYSPEYVKAMWLMLQHEEADDFIICSGKSVYLEDIILHIFKRLQISEDQLRIDISLMRPTDIKDIFGDNTKARKILGWSYNLDFFDVLDMILEEELQNYNRTENSFKWKD